MKFMNLSTPRRRFWWAMSPFIALTLTAAATAPAMAHRLGPDRTATAPKLLAGRSITILGAGDILVHPPTWAQAQKDSGKLGQYDFDKILSRVRPVVSGADLAICHMEAPMGPGKPQDFPRFNAPLSLARSVKAVGFDGCSTASNHSLDQGPGGVAANLGALDRAGLKHAGTARTAVESLQPTVYVVKGVRVGHLSYAYGINPGTSFPAGKKWMANVLGNGKAVLAAAHRLKTVYHADIVILSAHWGIEKHHELNAQQVVLAKLFLSSPDVDAIIGHHTHVVQAAEQIGGKWVFYGVGNLLARHDFPIQDNKEGILPRMTFAQQPDGKWRCVLAEAIPIWLGIDPDVRVFNLPHSLAVMSDADRRRAKYAAAYERIRGYLGQRGAYQQGLRLVDSNG